MSTKLSIDNLSQISENVAKPAYRREELSPGIVHVGVGNFHRAHQSVYLHKLFELGIDLDWAIVGAGVTPYDDVMRNKLVAQDFMTTVVELDPQQLTAQITGAMIDYIDIDSNAMIEVMANSETRIVSLTVTEGGYFVDAETNGFDQSHPEILADANTPESPKTVFGIIIKALEIRKQNGIHPFTVMSCDNLPENGHVAKNTVLGLAKLVDTW